MLFFSAEDPADGSRGKLNDIVSHYYMNDESDISSPPTCFLQAESAYRNVPELSNLKLLMFYGEKCSKIENSTLTGITSVIMASPVLHRFELHVSILLLSLDLNTQICLLIIQNMWVLNIEMI